jgi:ribosomal-protein-serine acetyltransferase
LIGNRVELRKASLADLEESTRAVAQNLDRLRPFLHWARRPWSPAIQEKFLSEVDQLWGNSKAYHFAIRKEGVWVGAISVHSICASERRCELGFWLTAEAEGQGLMRETVRLLESELCRVGYTRIILRAFEENQRSISVAQALGYRGAQTAELQPGRERQVFFEKII